MNAAIDGVHVTETSSGPVPVVLVGVDDASDVLPIFVGFEEALAIRRGLDAATTERPLTHDLLLDTIEELGGHIERIAITDLSDGTYIADIHLDTPRGSATIDARPSDALALAARTNAPIALDAEVFDAGRRVESELEDLRDIREVVADE